MKEIIFPLGSQNKIIPLSEGSFTIDKTKLFVPFDEIKDDLQARSSGSLLVEIQPFVIVTPEDVLILDTGLGFANDDGTQQIHQNLRNVGIDPGHVTKILLSHLHKDHAGGVSLERDHTKLSFPHATYFLQQKELQFAFEKGFPSYIPEELEVLRNSSQVELLTKDPQLQQMKHRFVAKYDYDGKKASQLRQQWWKKGQEEKWIFLFYHDINAAMYTREESQ